MHMLSPPPSSRVCERHEKAIPLSLNSPGLAWLGREHIRLNLIRSFFSLFVVFSLCSHCCDVVT